MPILTPYQKERIERQYKNIRRLYKTGKYTYKQLARRAGRTTAWVYYVISGSGMPMLEKEFDFEDLTGSLKEKKGTKEK